MIHSPSRGRSKTGATLTLQGQGDNLCCRACIVLCHAPVVPRISALSGSKALAQGSVLL